MKIEKFTNDDYAKAASLASIRRTYHLRANERMAH